MRLVRAEEDATCEVQMSGEGIDMCGEPAVACDLDANSDNFEEPGFYCRKHLPAGAEIEPL